MTGLQGQPSDIVADVTPASAYEDYPEPGPATPATGPQQSYFVGLGPEPKAGGVGDIEIVRGGGAPPAISEGEPDLAVAKSMPAVCIRGALCTARITVTNSGSGTWSGPLFLSDFTEPVGLGIVEVGSPWICAAIGASTVCYHPPVELGFGQSRTLVVDIAIPLGYGSSDLTNCAAVNWPLRNAGDPNAVVREVQVALRVLAAIEAHRRYRKLLTRRPPDGEHPLPTRAAAPQFRSERYWRQDLRGRDDWLFGHVFKVALAWMGLEPYLPAEVLRRATPLLATSMVVT